MASPQVFLVADKFIIFVTEDGPGSYSYVWRPLEFHPFGELQGPTASASVYLDWVRSRHPGATIKELSRSLPSQEDPDEREAR